jgi:hypothetical protein
MVLTILVINFIKKTYKGLFMKIAIFLTFMIFSQLAFSHADHPPQIAYCKTLCTKAEIELAGPFALKFLIDRGALDKEWAQKKISKVESIKFKKGPEWLLTVNDPKAKDKKLQNLFIFITPDGILNGLNFTGK